MGMCVRKKTVHTVLPDVSGVHRGSRNAPLVVKHRYEKSLWRVLTRELLPCAGARRKTESGGWRETSFHIVS